MGSQKQRTFAGYVQRKLQQQKNSQIDAVLLEDGGRGTQVTWYCLKWQTYSLLESAEKDFSLMCTLILAQ